MEKPSMGKENNELVRELSRILEDNADKRIVVLGTTCTGKSTFLKSIKNASDMDDLVFPQLTKAESDYVCQSPWTPKIGETINRLVKEKVRIEPGNPVFGTVVLESDLIIYLRISDELLKKRTGLRGSKFEDAKNMQKAIEVEIKSSGLPVIEFPVG